MTSEERAWLHENDGKIIVNNESGWPPIIDTDENGNPYGIVIDFQKLLEKKLNFKFKFDRLDSWQNFMKRFQRGQIDVNNNLQKNSEREKYALFTKPYIEIPNAIIVRKEVKESLSLDTMRGIAIAVTNDFAIHKHINDNYHDLKLVPLKSDLECLLQTSTRNVDAAVVNLAVASYLIEQKGISNLRVAGYADYANALCFASRKDLPILNRILQKGLNLISQSEKDAIFNKWISLGYVPFYKSTKFWIVSSSIAGIVTAIFVLVLVWNHSLKQQVRSRTESLENTNNRLTREVQERKQAEEAMRESEEQYRRLAENSPDIIYRMSLPEGKYDYVSPAAIQISGYEPKQWYENPLIIRTIIHPDWQGYFEAEWRKLLEGQLSPTYEYQIVHKDKSVRWINQRNVPVRNADGDLVAIEGIVTDITERKKIEEDLRTSHERFLKVLNSIDATVYVADMETYEILFMNRYMVESFGSDMTGEICWKAFRNENGPCDHCTNDKLVDPNGNPTGVYVWKDRNPVTGRFYINHDRALEWTDGRLVRLQIATDITELIKIEEQLRQAQKLESIGRLAGGVAHDFNNMLSIIIGNSEMILEDLDRDDSEISKLREIHKAAQRSAELTRQLLAFARKQVIAPKVLYLNETIEGMLNMLRRLIGEDIDLAWIPKADLWPTIIDPSQVDQVLANLCVNARDAINGVGKVTIETDNVVFDADYCREHEGFKPGDYIMIAVSDSGSGMGKETLNNIFDPFFSTKDIGQGTGLGLATVYGIVKQNNGFVNVYSEPGKGTTLKLYFPKHEISGIQEQKHEKTKKEIRGNETVLLVEDEEGILRMITAMLERLGYRVLPTSSPVEAVRIGESYPDEIQILMTDVVMPEMSGRDVAEKLLQSFPKLKCLFMSGYTANVIAHRGVLDEGLYFINKPFTKNDLSSKIREVLDGNEIYNQE